MFAGFQRHQCLPLLRRHNTLTMLMTERRGAIIFCKILASPNASPQASQYLTILMTERGRHYVCRILALPMPPPSHDATILLTTMLTTERRGAIICCRILAPPQCPLPPTLQYLFILMTERGAPLSFVVF